MLSLDLPKKKGLFITGTDTGVGKTLVAGAIARLLTNEGLQVGIYKPIASGCGHVLGGLVSADAEFLAMCTNHADPVTIINPVSYETPAAPVFCEQRESRAVDFEAIASIYRSMCQRKDVVIVEGIGGVRVPVSEGVDVLDLMRQFALPAVVVARPNLGTINHTLLTVDAIRAVGLNVAGIVINGFSAATAGAAEESVAEILRKWAKAPILAVVPRDPRSSVEHGKLGQVALDALSDCDWAKLTGFVRKPTKRKNYRGRRRGLNQG
jgi:dethiobiotin synthetase